MTTRGIDGSVVIVTGAGQGIGAGIARRLAHEGAEVVLVDRVAETLEAVRSELARSHPDRIHEALLDITNPAACASMVERVITRHGRIDGLVNCAGVLHIAPILEHDPTEFARVLEVNVTGTFLVTQAVARTMVARRRGSVVSIASVAAHAPRFRQAAYSASKAAVASLMRSCALELAASGVRFNCVSPGPTETAMLRDMMAKSGGAARILAGVPEEFRVGIPLGALMQVDDIADAVLFLLSDAAARITMQDLVVDGGQTLGA